MRSLNATSEPLSGRPDLRRRAAYACRPENGRGRAVPEPKASGRGDFQRDRDRIIHSSAFRRLALKTQVFLPEAGDQYRTRLTHTIEVAQIARTIARALRLDEDLTEALALAHDLGHPPFGHTGEEALDAALRDRGGFDHNAQALRIVTELERRYPAFDGLNLTWETLEGLVKRNGPVTPPAGLQGCRGGPLPHAVAALDAALSLDLGGFASGEAQAAAVADDIAYNAHDLEDGLDAGLLTLDRLRAVPFLDAMLDGIARQHPGLDHDLTIRVCTRLMVGRFVEDAIAESRRRLAASRPSSAAALRALGFPTVALSSGMAEASNAVKAFLHVNMYRHPDLTRLRADAGAIVGDLARAFLAAPARLPPAWAGRAARADDPARVGRVVADYVSGLTDRGAVGEHRRLFSETPDLR